MGSSDIPRHSGSIPGASTLKIGSLFSGIGGFELGFESTGRFQTAWQVECDPYANKVLAKHWPNVRRHDDVRTWPEKDTEPVDVLMGGFPCQDISTAGSKKGLEGERSGLFFEIIRIAGILRPRFICLENVAALATSRGGLNRVIGHLTDAGYDCEWEIISAKSVGAWHQRRRMFIIATRNVADTSSQRCQETVVRLPEQGCEAGSEVLLPKDKRTRQTPPWQRVSDPASYWQSEPRICRVVDGLPNRVDRVTVIGNAICPQVSRIVAERVIALNDHLT